VCNSGGGGDLPREDDIVQVERKEKKILYKDTVSKLCLVFCVKLSLLFFIILIDLIYFIFHYFICFKHVQDYCYSTMLIFNLLYIIH